MTNNTTVKKDRKLTEFVKLKDASFYKSKTYPFMAAFPYIFKAIFMGIFQSQVLLSLTKRIIIIEIRFFFCWFGLTFL